MSNSSSANEVSHYVVTAHPPGAVLRTAKCNFMAPDSLVRCRVLCVLLFVLLLRVVDGEKTSCADGEKKIIF